MKHDLTAPSGAPLSPPKRLTSRKYRQALEAALDRLLAAVDGVLSDLDALDGDADLEPSLGFPEGRRGWPGQTGYFALVGAGTQDDREAQCEDEGAETGDDEYSLGWAESESVKAPPGVYAAGFPQDELESDLAA